MKQAIQISRPKQGPQKHVPQRTCIACRQVQGKRALLRIVRTAQGVEVDPTGKKAGRGAYLHPYQTCWRAALRSNRIEQALRTRLSEQERQALQSIMESLPETENGDEGSENEAKANDKVTTVPHEPASRQGKGR